MTALDVALSAAEATALADCEAVITRGKRTFVEVGNALAAVRESRLYRATHATFEDYCSERWDFSRYYANRLTQAATVMELLPIGNSGNLELPATESQARPLSRQLPAADATEDVRAAAHQEIREAWTEAVATAPVDRSGKPKITASHVATTVARRLSATVADVADPDPKTTKARRPLPLAFRDAAYDLVKAVEKVERLTADERFPRNAQQVADSCTRDLSCASELLATVMRRVTNPAPGA